jgi:hypothetical protein
MGISEGGRENGDSGMLARGVYGDEGPRAGHRR